MRKELHELALWRFALTLGGTLLIIGVKSGETEPRVFGPIMSLDMDRLQAEGNDFKLYLKTMTDRSILFNSNGTIRFSDHSEEINGKS